MKKKENGKKKSLEEELKETTNRVRTMPTYGDPYLKMLKEATLKDCEEAEKIHARTQQILAEAKIELDKYS